MLRSLLVAALAVAVPTVRSSGPVSPDVRGVKQEYRAPSGTLEHCVALTHAPGGSYADADVAAETAFCAIDFYGTTHALCPKVFSTSPGTLVYELGRGQYAGDPAAFERSACRPGGISREASGPPLSFKMSVNTAQTSATFANAALVYYHFARYFDASVHVPVAVFRAMDREQHNKRVAARGLALSAGKSSLAMNHAAWSVLARAEGDPDSYRPRDELFTPEGLVYGVLLQPEGRRYSEEINGTRASGWGEGQNRDFQETAPFRALRSAAPLADAIAEGRAAALRNPTLARATGRDATPAQMVFWMADLIDISLLDHLFGQQDRVGNVDFLPYWYWVEGGEVRRRPAEGRTPPPDLAALSPVYLKRTELGDNDAAIRTSYANFARRTGMLANLRHFRAETYRRLMRLDADFRARGPLHEYARTTFGLSAAEFAQVEANVASAAVTLRASCTAGRLRFDVEPAELLRQGAVAEQKVACDAS
jgi:hypothetical protein